MTDWPTNGTVGTGTGTGTYGTYLGTYGIGTGRVADPDRDLLGRIRIGTF